MTSNKKAKKQMKEISELEKVEMIDEIENETPSLVTQIQNLNNVLIAHKDKEELRDYRRMFYTLFFMFCVLFLLWVFGLWYIQKGYSLKLENLQHRHQDEIKSAEFIMNNKLKQQEFALRIKYLNLEDDDSITKYVDPTVSFGNLTYVPDGLVPVETGFIKDSKWWGIQIQALAQQNLNKLAEQFFNETQQEIIVVSGYRSYAYQKWIKDRGCPDNLCAKAWHSEHQSGYAVDLYSASTQAQWLGSNTLRKHFDWLNANAHVYGFHNPYQKWVEIDGYEPEPWHWRYVWEDLARYLKQHDLTFAEFYSARQNGK